MPPVPHTGNGPDRRGKGPEPSQVEDMQGCLQEGQGRGDKGVPVPEGAAYRGLRQGVL